MTQTYRLFAIGVVTLAIAAKVGQGFFPEEAKIVRHIPTASQVVALTFDDGPNAKTTPELLRVLREKNVRATFFILGENAAEHPELVAQAAKEGHEIASHSYTHRHLKNLNREECAAELDKAEDILNKIGQRPRLFRPPGGLYNETVLEEAKKRGYTTILWSVDPNDWKRPSVDFVVRSVTEKAVSGGIVLLHDGLYPLPTPKAVAQIIDRLRAKGFSIVTVSELLKYQEVRETGQLPASQ